MERVDGSVSLSWQWAIVRASDEVSDRERAAWRLEGRERWIGWDESRRQENLSKVVCNSRFLIVPYVRVRNLASHALSLCIRQLEEDWYERYKIRPVLLETFVERGRFQGRTV